MSGNNSGTSKRRKVKIGDQVKLGKGRMVLLPDGSVVTARGAYRVAHEGAHKIIGGAEFDGIKG